MVIRKSPLLGLMALAILSLLPASRAAAQLQLRNATVYEVDSAGNFDGFMYWDTIYGNGAYDVFAIEGTDAAGGAILNGGGSTRSFASDLATGTHHFTFLMEPISLTPNGGINLYFNDSLTPNISAYVAPDSASTTPIPTDGLTYNPFGGGDNTLHGALSFTTNNLDIKLTGLSIKSPNVAPVLDRVSPFSAVPGGVPDLVVQVTFTVTDASIDVIQSNPEPGSLALLAGLAVSGVVCARRRC